MRAAEEGQHMVLAERVELDVADDDHLVIINIEKGLLQDVIGCLLVAAGEEGHGLFNAGGGVAEAVTVGVFAEAAE